MEQLHRQRPLRLFGALIAVLLTTAVPGIVSADRDHQTARPMLACSLRGGLPAVTLEQARGAALAGNPGAFVIGAKLEREHGCLLYEVKLSNGAEVTVDAGSGQVVATEAEDDDDD